MPAISDRRPVLNRRHWLAKNLVALWVPINGGRVLANLVTPGQGESHLTRANNAYHRNDALIAWDNTSGSGYSYTGGYLPTSAQIPCPLTFAWFGDVIGERNGDYQRIFGLEEIGLAHSLEFQRHDSNGEVNFHYEDGAFNGPEVTVTASGFLQGRRRSLIGVLGGTVAACATYLNGTLGGTGATVGVQNWTGGDSVCIGPIDGLQTGCTNTGFRAGFLANRPISSVEAGKVHANPEDMWVQPWRQPRFIAIGSTGTAQALAGSIVAVSTVTAALTVAHPLAGTIASTSAVTAALTVAHPLAATVAATSTVTAALTVQHPLAATVAATTALTADLAAAHTLAATVAAQSTVTGDITSTHTLAATVAVTSTVTGDLTATHPLAATVAAQSTVTGDLAAVHTLAATVAATSTVTGDMVVAHPLAASVAAVSTVTADLSVSTPGGGPQPLAGTIGATSTVTGDLAVTHTLAGTVGATSASTGDLIVAHALAATVAGQSTIAGAMVALLSLSGQVNAVLSMVGTLYEPVVTFGPRARHREYTRATHVEEPRGRHVERTRGVDQEE